MLSRKGTLRLLSFWRWKVWVGAEPVAWRAGKMNGERRMGKAAGGGVEIRVCWVGELERGDPQNHQGML